MATPFEHMTEGVDVVAQVGSRVGQRVADARLRGKMDDVRECAVAKKPRRRFRVGKVDARKREAGQVRKRRQPGRFQRNVIVGFEVVDPGDVRTLGEQRARRMHADEAGRAGYEDVLVAHIVFHSRRLRHGERQCSCLAARRSRRLFVKDSHLDDRTASARNLPARMCSIEVVMVSNAICT